MTPKDQQKIKVIEFKLQFLKININCRQQLIDTLTEYNGKDLDKLQNLENEKHRILTRQNV